MKKLYLLLILILLLGCNQIKNSIDVPDIKKGNMNLDNWNFTDNGVLYLDGEWEFYWDHLFAPNDFQNLSHLL